ncbi:MAG: hypothetical protein J6U45_08560 [Alistipes sp.]|nr:hypothetical protein [Alistipes sp.]
MSNPLKQINEMLEIAKVAVENIKAENKRLRQENERLLSIIESLTKSTKDTSVEVKNVPIQ